MTLDISNATYASQIRKNTRHGAKLYIWDAHKTLHRLKTCLHRFRYVLNVYDNEKKSKESVSNNIFQQWTTSIISSSFNTMKNAVHTEKLSQRREPTLQFSLEQHAVHFPFNPFFPQVPGLISRVVSLTTRFARTSCKFD